MRVQLPSSTTIPTADPFRQSLSDSSLTLSTGVDDQRLFNSSTASIYSGLMVLFNDGWQIIFSFVDFFDLIHIRAVSSYFSELTRPETCKLLTTYHIHPSSSYKQRRLRLSAMLKSPLRVYVTTIICPDTELCNDHNVAHRCLALDEVMIVSQAQLPRLHTLECSLKFIPPSTIHSQDDGSHADLRRSKLREQKVRNQIVTQFHFPSTLTSLTISYDNERTALVQAVFNTLPLLAQTLTKLKLFGLNMNVIEVDFSPLTSLINLHTCEINTTFDHFGGARVKDLMPILVQLPIRHLTYSFENRLDWGLLLPSTPLMTNLQHWSIGPTSVTPDDWSLLNMHAPNLTSCDCIIHILPEDGYIIQGIHHLSKLKRLAVQHVYDPYQSGLGELTRMPSLEWLRYDTIEQYGALVTKGVLFSLHCLTSLVSLEMARFNLSYLSSDDYQTAFQSLPPQLKIAYLTHCSELDDLCTGLSTAHRLIVVEISHLTLKNEDLITVHSKLLAVCQALPYLRSFVVKEIEGYEGSFQYHTTTEVKSIDLTIPAKPLVGIETNPGPFSFSVTTIVTPQTLFKDGLHLIYSFLATLEWAASFRTCVNWYQAALTEPCRCVTFLASMPIPTKSFPLDYHITQLLAHSSSGGTPTATQQELKSLIAYFPKVTSINWVIHEEDIADMNWPKGLTSLGLEFRGHEAPLLLDSIFTIITLKRLLLSGLNSKSYQKLHGWSSLTSLEYLSLNQYFGPSEFDVTSRSIQSLPASLISLSINSKTSLVKRLADLPFLPYCTLIDLHNSRLRPNTLPALAKSTPNLKELRPLAFGRQSFRSIAYFTQLERIEFNQLDDAFGNQDLVDLIEGLKLLSHLTTIEISAEFKPLSSSQVWRELGSSISYLPHLSTLDCHCSSGELMDVLADCFSNRLTSLTLYTGIERSDQTLALDALSKMVKLKHLVINHYVNLTTAWLLIPEVVQPITVVAIDAHPKSIIEYLANPLILPQLEYLRVNSKDDTIFVFSWTVGQTYGNYRQQPPASITVTSQHAATTTQQVTNESKAETVPPFSTTRMNVPAEPLVGIESNPGPESESLCSGPSTPFATSPSVRAQTIFKEGLHIIYSYLTTREWCRAFKTCHGWKLAMESEPSRQMAYSFLPYDSHSGTTLLKFGPFPPQRFKYHFTHLKTHRRDKDPIVRLIPNQIVTLMNSIPFLRTIEVTIPESYHPTSFSPISNLDLDDLHQLEHSCQHLRTFSIRFMNCAYTKFISHLFPHCDSLTSLTLNELSRKEDFTIYSPISTFHQLTHLSVEVVWESEEVYDHDGWVVDVIEDHLSEEINFLTKANIEHLPTSITSINLNGSFDSDLLTRLDPLSNFVENINLGQAELKLGDLKLLHSIVPGLVALQPSRFCLNDLSDLGLFRHLTQISFYNPPKGKGVKPSLIESMIVDGLLTCSTTLIHLSFRFWHFKQESAWKRLGEGLPNITWINLDAEFIPEPKLFLQWFPRLTKLTRGQTYNRLIPESSYGGVQLKPVKDIPAARLVGIESNPGPAGTQTAPSIATPPAKPLVGIETNPGPFSFSVTTIVTPQTLFKDGLHLIYSFLATLEWAASFRTCVNWYQAALTEPCREIVFDFSMRIPKRPFPLCYHFTSLISDDCGGRGQRQLQALIAFLPALRHFSWYQLNDIPDLKWSVGLTSLELRAQQSPMILDSIFRITTLKRLSLPWFRGKKWQKFHLWSNLTSLQYLSLSWPSIQKGLKLSTRALQSLPVSVTSLHIGGGVYTNLSDLTILPNCTDFSHVQFSPGDLALLSKSTPNLRTLSGSFGSQNLRDISLFTHLTRIEFTEVDERWKQSAVDDLIEGLKLSTNLTSIQASSHFWSLSSPEVWKELVNSDITSNIFIVLKTASITNVC